MNARMSAQAAQISPPPLLAGAPALDSDALMSRRVSQAVRMAQTGDREALGFLYVRYADDIYGYVKSIVRDPHEAEDITQQVFAKLIRVIDKYREQEVPFLACECAGS